MENLNWGLQMTVLGMGLVFFLLALLWLLLTIILKLDAAEEEGGEAEDAARENAPAQAKAPDTSARPIGSMEAELVAAILIAAHKHRQTCSAKLPKSPKEDKTMRRYTLNINDREFIADVQEFNGDRFEVVIGGQTYAVILASEEKAVTNAASVPAAAAAPAAPAAAAPRKPAGGKNTQGAPMPGVILEVNVKPGDTVTRGQQLLILDAMKMHNVIGAQENGTIEELYVDVGQSVAYGTPLVKFRE